MRLRSEGKTLEAQHPHTGSRQCVRRLVQGARHPEGRDALPPGQRVDPPRQLRRQVELFLAQREEHHETVALDRRQVRRLVDLWRRRGDVALALEEAAHGQPQRGHGLLRVDDHDVSLLLASPGDTLVLGLVLVYQVESWVMLALLLAIIAVKGFTLVSAIGFRPDAFDATGKQTKSTWVGILTVGLVLELATLFVPLGLIGRLLNIGFTIAALVYLADVRPALKEVMRRPRW
ncbi:hypothetical protein QE405_004014 [Nocardioides zeae]|uniref:DUF2516 family protein n=1 Tax=Nocardioides zeae TaxID=1457234 RepID=A0AAJ1U355_9ACTN|nr:hypothetical protein [Nocardioides zeae]